MFFTLTFSLDFYIWLWAHEQLLIVRPSFVSEFFSVWVKIPTQRLLRTRPNKDLLQEKLLLARWKLFFTAFFPHTPLSLHTHTPLSLHTPPSPLPSMPHPSPPPSSPLAPSPFSPLTPLWMINYYSQTSFIGIQTIRNFKMKMNITKNTSKGQKNKQYLNCPHPLSSLSTSLGLNSFVLLKA